MCSFYNLARFNEKFERAYVLQAQENARWLRRQKEYLDNERALMGNEPGWVVGKRRYITTFDDKPDIDVLDSRKVGPL
jgi:GRIM-19 protein